MPFKGKSYWLNVEHARAPRDHGRRQARADGRRRAAGDHGHADRAGRRAEPGRAARSSSRAPSSCAATAPTATGRTWRSRCVSLGIEPVEVRIVGDGAAELERALREGLGHDLLVDLGRARADARRPHGRAARARGRAAARPRTKGSSSGSRHGRGRSPQRLRRPYKEFAAGVYKQASIPEGAIVVGLAGTAPALVVEADELRRGDAAGPAARAAPALAARARDRAAASGCWSAREPPGAARAAALRRVASRPWPRRSRRRAATATGWRRRSAPATSRSTSICSSSRAPRRAPTSSRRRSPSRSRSGCSRATRRRSRRSCCRSAASAG